MNDLKEIKEKLDEMQKMLEAIYRHFQQSESLPPAKVYQIKEKAIKKALELREKLKVE
ncbi:MAG: hypothetical protein RMI30_07095 [Thermodesulfovibrio sp.]|nr:hypothetical protein [Thermodesulfovibrio sp.]